jgi:hypothetical protein
MTEEFELRGVPFEDRDRLPDEYPAAAFSLGPSPTWPPPCCRSAWATWRAALVSAVHDSISGFDPKQAIPARATFALARGSTWNLPMSD